ncbi:hypothetical protein TRICI_000109 [Trichomonascus ciferrii]|uniref:Thioredoxin domain-containing protein n=1 Tax=Trichomonascus ciferrii TaxID=44093 RepID=A0A642VED3_9ASCO|nr:hypothetical protein TRICI_000109 [Trichomonascus ciferrii]
MDNPGGIKNIKSEDQFFDVIKSGLVYVLLYRFGDINCEVACDMIKYFPERYPDLKVYRLDVNEVMEVAMGYRIQEFPTSLIFRNGKMKGSITGVKEVDIRHLIEGVQAGPKKK